MQGDKRAGDDDPDNDPVLSTNIKGAACSNRGVAR